MGGAFVSVADDASAVFWNPAGLLQLDQGKGLLQHATLFEGDFQFAGVAYPTLDLGTFGVGFMRIGTGDIPGRDRLGQPTGTFSFAQSELVFAYGKKLFPYLGVGASVKAVAQELGDANDVGFGADVGLLLPRWRGLGLGLTWQDAIGARLTLNQSREVMPWNLKGGLSYERFVAADRVGLLFSADLDQVQGGQARVRVGGEVAIRRQLFLRAGLDKDEITFGAGVGWRSFAFDYAYQSVLDLEASHRFSLSIAFGSSRAERLATHNKAAEEKALRVYQESQKEKVQNLFERAQTFDKAGAVDSALFFYQQVLAYDAENARARERMAALKEQVKSQAEQAVQARSQELIVTDHLRLAEQYQGEGNLALAQAELQQVLAQSPQNPEALRRQKEIAGQIGRQKMAFDSTAEVFFTRKDYSGAIGEWRKALVLNPGDTLFERKIKRAEERLSAAQLLQEGLAKYTAGEYSAALAIFGNVLRVDPQNPVAREYQKLSQQKMAKVTTLEDLKKDPQAWQWYLAGLESFQKGDYEKAIELWNQVLAVYPNNQNALRNIEQAKKRLPKSGQ